MKKTTKRYTDTPIEKDVTCTELMEAALTQCATAKKIVAELKMLFELRKIAHKKRLKRLQNSSESKLEREINDWLDEVTGQKK